MHEQITPTVGRTALALNLPIGEARQHQLDALWAMSPADRIAAMWRGDLTLFQLTSWSSRRPDEVPLLGGEFAYIVMRTPSGLRPPTPPPTTSSIFREGTTTVPPHDDRPLDDLLVRARARARGCTAWLEHLRAVGGER